MTKDTIFVVTKPETELTAGELDADITGPGWYFWDETWSVAHGAFDTRNQAEQNLRRYLKRLEGGN